MKGLATGMAVVLLAGVAAEADEPQKPRTVHVKLRDAGPHTPDLAFRLTERLNAEIERLTPYKVVGTGQGADAIVSGAVGLSDEAITIEYQPNHPRRVISRLEATVEWTEGRDPEADKQVINLSRRVSYYPEVAESATDAYEGAIQEMCRRIIASTGPLSSHERRLREIERKLDLILEGMKGPGER